MITTEELLTRPEGFGLGEASPAQRAVCQLIDGLPVPESILDALPEEGFNVFGPDLDSGRPKTAVILAAIKTAKTMISCAAASRMALTVDCSGLKHGECPRVSIVAPKLDLAQVAYSQISGAWEASPTLRPLIISTTADTLTVRHPTGRPIEISCVASGKAGAGLVARWSAGVIFDEAPRMNGREDGVVNLDDMLAAVAGRVLPGGQILMIGSPWAPYGPVYDLAQNAGATRVIRATGPALNPNWWTPERCEELQRTNPVAYQTDVLGEFADPESGLLSPIAVHRNTRAAPEQLPPRKGANYVAAIDPAEGDAKGNAWTLVIVELEGMQRKVACAREWRGMSPGACLKDIAQECARYGLREAVTDQYAASANADLARQHGLLLRIEATSAKSKLEDFTNLATLVHEDRVELPPVKQFINDLLSVKKRTTLDGAKIVLPKTGNGRHCDFAPALASALRRGGTGYAVDFKQIVENMKRHGWV